MGSELFSAILACLESNQSLCCDDEDDRLLLAVQLEGRLIKYKQAIIDLRTLVIFMDGGAGGCLGADEQSLLARTKVLVQ